MQPAFHSCLAGWDHYPRVITSDEDKERVLKKGTLNKIPVLDKTPAQVENLLIT